MKKYFETDRLLAVAAEEKDIKYIMGIEEGEEYRNFIWQGTLEEHRSEILDEHAYLIVFIEKNTLEKIGYSLCEKNSRFDVFELRRIAMTTRGKGYGKEAIQGLFKFAFEKLNINRLWLDVYPDNLVGINLYESLGMHRDGHLRQSYKSEKGIYRDQIIYSLLKTEWKN